MMRNVHPKPKRKFGIKWSNVLLYLGFGAFAPVVGAGLFLLGDGMQDLSVSRFSDGFKAGGAIGAVGFAVLLFSVAALGRGVSLIIARPSVTLTAEGVRYRSDFFSSTFLRWNEVVGIMDTDTALIFETRGDPLTVPAEFHPFHELVATARQYSGHPG